jgi:hydroxymethylpyrimidine pyrophosphatase-like HAD family hydrolase
MADTNYKDATLVRPLVLAVDLDETFAAGDGSNRETLFSVLEAHADEVRLIYMSHGSAEQLIGIAADAELPVPAVFMADSGTTVLKGDGTGTIEPIQRNIIQLWPGKEAVAKVIAELEGVTAIEDEAPCRQGVKVEGEEALEALRARADGLGCHLDRRGEGEWNILPFGVDKGTTLGRYVVDENLAPNAVLAIAEHTGDDCLFGRGWRGGVFAHADAELKEFGDRFHNVTVLEKSGAAGVLDALRSQGWLELAK